MKLGIRGQLTDVITCVKFLVDRFRGYRVLTPPKLPFPIDLLRRPYNSVAVSCDTVIIIIILTFVRCTVPTIKAQSEAPAVDRRMVLIDMRMVIEIANCQLFLSDVLVCCTAD